MHSQIITIVFFGLLGMNSCLPKECYGSSTTNCYPVIPSQLQTSGSDLGSSATFRLRNATDRYWALNTLPTGLFEGTSLKILTLNYAGLRFLYLETFQPIKGSLEKLYMNGNLFDFFHLGVLRGMTRLKVLELRDQEITSVEVLSKLHLHSLETIDLSGNKISQLSLLDLDNTGPLDIILDQNKLYKVNLTNVNKIRYLSVRKNNLEKLVNTSFSKSCVTLKHLNLSENRLDDEIWHSLQGITTLESLILSFNVITYISASVVNSQMNLTFLDLSNNDIHSLAGMKLQSGKVTHCFLSFNSISDLPYGLISSSGTFGNIWTGIIDLSHNFLQDITINLPNCNKKCHVFLDSNQIVNINFYFSSETHLESLNISSNRLIQVPHPLVKSDLYDISDNPLDTKNVLQALHQYPLKSASKLHIRNIEMFCTNEVDHKLLLENYFVFSNLKLIDLRYNCIPIELLCKIQLNNSASFFDVKFDYNLYRNSSTGCLLMNKNLEALSLQSAGVTDTDIKSIFQYDMETISTNFSFVNLYGNSLESMPHLKLTSLDRSENVLFVIANNSLRYFHNITLTYYRKGLVFGGRSLLDFSNNKISLINQFHFVFLGSYLFDHEIVLNLSSNQIVDIDKCVSFASLNSFLLNIGDIKFILNLSFNAIQEFKINDVFHDMNQKHIYGTVNVYLDLSSNRLSDMPHTLAFNEIFLYLQSIDLSHNKITQMPQKSEQMVRKMFLGHNKIEHINFTLPNGERVSTEELYLEFNKIVFIYSAAFENLTSLKRLDLRGNLLYNVPKGLLVLQSLTYLDISVNQNIDFRGVTIFKTMRRLKTLVLTDDDTFLSKYDQEYGLHCSCDLLFLRNYTLKTTGRCSSPPEVLGYHVSCFPTTYCPSPDPLYMLTKTVTMCRDDEYSDFLLVAKQQQNVIIIKYQRSGKHRQTRLLLELFRNDQLLEKQTSNETGNERSFISFLATADYACVEATFEGERTLRRCIYLKTSELPLSSSSQNNLTIVLGVLFAIAFLILTVLIVLYILQHRNKNKDKDSEPKEAHVRNCKLNQESYESTTQAPEQNYDVISPPTIYEDVHPEQTTSASQPSHNTKTKHRKGKHGSKREKMYTNMAFSAI